MFPEQLKCQVNDIHSDLLAMKNISGRVKVGCKTKMSINQRKVTVQITESFRSLAASNALALVS